MEQCLGDSMPRRRVQSPSWPKQLPSVSAAALLWGAARARLQAQLTTSERGSVGETADFTSCPTTRTLPIRCDFRGGITQDAAARTLRGKLECRNVTAWLVGKQRQDGSMPAGEVREWAERQLAGASRLPPWPRSRVERAAVATRSASQRAWRGHAPHCGKQRAD